MLRTRGLTKSFGGLTAVDDVDFELAEEGLTSLIGPNGAGKTTFFDLLTGRLDPTAGAIDLRDGMVSASGTGNGSSGGTGSGSADDEGESDGEWVDVTGAGPDEMARMGVHRSFQLTNVFPESTVLENVRVAAQAHGDGPMTFWRNVSAFEEFYGEARSVLERVGLSGMADRPAASLSHGEKRQLEVAIALAGDPDVLLLDEPTAGVSSESVDDVIELIEDVAADHAVLLVEHNMDVVMGVSDRVVVLNRGALIADGTPAEIRDDPAVQEAYLGGYEPGATADAEADADADGEGGSAA